ncbi:conserved hypothetical protein [Verticillium alfalfae VaMs.102]|uniref:DUF427 domain-containing protein n=1 Tax=Verticillium alfalfae (strain VaMs.102 / ATCC MYA-4576 / FGSC 10136) TaxID=526221 RepID=C9SN27_VERA1|nr:conserved hypothetical protein [Verticillium alfalfae VaMs.102]EEY20192.1 conserved hypothetical protein [Verticillium alfalfae VaMs.102]
MSGPVAAMKTDTVKVGAQGCDLHQLGLYLLVHGFLRTEPATRRIRVVHHGSTIADSRRGLLAWEHAAYPQYYIPEDDLMNIHSSNVGPVVASDGDATRQVFSFNVMEVQGVDLLREDHPAFGLPFRSVMRLRMSHDRGPLQNLVRFEFGSMDQWLEEDTPIYVHPKNPDLRVELLHSGRKIRIECDGRLLAESPYSVHLLESRLPTRYYIPYTAVVQRSAQLLKSDTVTECPYKGIASYYNVRLNHETTLEDLVWYYRHPTIECAAIAGMLCFYNEKVKIYIDGELSG